MTSKLLKIAFFITFLFSIAFILYVSPYIAINNLIKVAGDETKYGVVAHFMSKDEIKQNIINRYKLAFFAGLPTEDFIPEKRAEKEAIEESIEYAVDALIDEESISNLFFAIKNKGIKETNVKIETIYLYDGFSKFKVFFKFEGKTQEIVFSRYGLVFWHITDLVFPIDYNMFY